MTNEINLDDDDLGVSEINLDDDDDIFKSARLEPEPAKAVDLRAQELEPEIARSNGGLTNGHHSGQGARAESEEPVETDIPLEVIIVAADAEHNIFIQDDDDRPFDNAHLKPGLQLQSEPATISVPHQTLTSFYEVWVIMSSLRTVFE